MSISPTSEGYGFIRPTTLIDPVVSKGRVGAITVPPYDPIIKY